MYTLVDTPELIARIDHDLALMLTRLEDVIGTNLLSVYLCGGYGRGEGSVIQREDKNVPYNDYDLLLVTKRGVSPQDLKVLGEALAQELGIRFVDLAAVSKSRLPRLPETVFVRDLYVSKLLWGEDVRDRIPHIDPSKLSLEEARVLLRNRLICFFELTPEAFFLEEDLSEDEHRHLVLQLAKAAIAVHVSSLLEHGTYHSSYAQQMSLVGDAVLRKAYEVKLGLLDPQEVSVRDFWLDVRVRYVDAADEFLDNQLNLAHGRESVVRWGKRMAKCVLRGEVVVANEKKHQIEQLVLMLLRAYPDDLEAMGEVLDGLHNWFGIDLEQSTWFELSVLLTELWETYRH